MIDIYALHNDEIALAQDLIWEIFLEFEGIDYEQAGIQNFHAYLTDIETIENLQLFGAFEEEKLVGVIATRDHGRHISLLFVDAAYQQQGIGRLLWEYVKRICKEDTITVNSSPYAIPIYHKLGFVDTDSEQVIDEIRFTPMKYNRVEGK